MGPASEWPSGVLRGVPRGVPSLRLLLRFRCTLDRLVIVVTAIV